MKRLLFALLLSLLLIFVACDDAGESSSDSSSSSSESSSQSDFTIEYRVQEGGRLTGEALQYLNAGQSSSEVRVTPEYGYKFVGWDDGVTTVKRTDVASESKVYTAKFIKLNIVTFSCNSDQGILNGLLTQGIEPGKSTTKVTAKPRTGFKFICWDNGETNPELVVTPEQSITITAIFAPDSLEFPSLSINTEGGASILSKDEYLLCTVDITNTGSAQELIERPAKVRGRGNTSFEVEKKSYKLKFDEKTNLFGFGEAKDWALISNHFDLSLIRNYLALNVAGIFETQQNTSKAQFVDLYVNGEYRGVYLLCEHVEVKEHRIEISTSTDIDTGYLIEIDARADTVGTYIFGKYHAIKSPDVDDGELTQEHMNFIIEFLNKAYNTAVKKSYDEVLELIDVESFAEAYIVYEMFNCVDVGYASFHMYKDAGGKLQCGPVWDFDRSVGNVRNNEDARRYDSLWAKKDNIWFAALLSHDEFKALVSEKLEEYLPKIKATLMGCYAYIDACTPSIERNFKRWRIIGTWVWPNPDELIEMQSWQEHYDYVKDYLEKSLAFMCEQYPSE